MPRRGTEPAPMWGALYDVADAQGGFFTLAQARDFGYSPPLIEYHVISGRLERVGRGIFRLVQYPSAEREELIVSWLWSDQRHLQP